MDSFLSIVRGSQDIMAMLVLGGVFERHPDLQGRAASRPTPAGCRTSCTGWTTPTSATATGCRRASSCPRLPSEYFAENIYVTFQDDWTAFKQADDMNWHRLMWANDFPHSDSTWPWSQEMLEEHARPLRPSSSRRSCAANVADLYGIDRAPRRPSARLASTLVDERERFLLSFERLVGDALVLDGVTAAYDRDPVVRGVTGRLPEGGSLALIGPNGAGKSTLIKAILGLVPVVAGTRRGARHHAAAGPRRRWPTCPRPTCSTASSRSASCRSC